MSPRKLARYLLTVPPLIVFCPKCGVHALLDSSVMVLMVRLGGLYCTNCNDAHRGRVAMVPVPEEDLP